MARTSGEKGHQGRKDIRANPCKNQLHPAAGQTNGRTSTKLRKQIVAMDGCVSLGLSQPERCRVPVPEAENFIFVGSSEFVKFWASSTKLVLLAKLVHWCTFGKAFKEPYK